MLKIRKISQIIFCLALLAGTFVFAPKANAAKAYDYEYVTQSAYPSALAPGATISVWIEVKNTGTKTWYNSGATVVRLGTGSQYGSAAQQRDYASEFANSDWLSNNRPVAILATRIDPGQETSFNFNIKAPTTPGIYKAYFTPVADGITWLKDIGIYWQITVVSGESGNQNSSGNQQSGSSITVTSLTLLPSVAVSIRSGDIYDFTVRANYSDGSVQDVTNMASWEVIDDTGNGTMHTGHPGRFIAASIGQCYVRATFGNKGVTSGVITVTPLG